MQKLVWLLIRRPFIHKFDVIVQILIQERLPIADIIIFIIDVSETCGYSIKEQNHLLNRVKKIFKRAEIIIVENKVDLKKIDTKNLKISCITNEGIKLLIEKIYLFYNNLIEKNND